MAVELVHLRTANSKTFDNGDGTYTFNAGGGIRHHKKNGVYVETNTKWVVNGTHYVTVDFPMDIDFDLSTRTATLTLDDGRIITVMPTLGIRNPTVSMTGDTINLVGLWRGVDVKVTLGDRGIKFKYTKTSTQTTQIGWQLGGDYSSLLGPIGYVDSTTKNWITVPSSISNGLLTIDISGVQIGIEIDPTLSLQPDPTSGNDSLLFKLADYNYGTADYITLTPSYTELISFNLNTIPSGSTIVSSELSLWHNVGTSTFGGTPVVSIYRMLVPWVEGTKNGATPSSGEVSWSYRQYNTVSWGTAGALGNGSDRYATASDSQGQDDTVNDWHKWFSAGIVADVQLWVNGTPNYGWSLVNANIASRSYASSDYAADASLRPKLAITYTLPSAAYMRTMKMW
jgi:hypothetical protein